MDGVRNYAPGLQSVYTTRNMMSSSVPSLRSPSIPSSRSDVISHTRGVSLRAEALSVTHGPVMVTD